VNNQKNKLDKLSKIIIGSFIVYTVILLAIFLPSYLHRRGRLYIVTNSYAIRYINGNWSNIDGSSEYMNKIFNIYENNELKGKFRLLYSDKMVLLDDQKNSVDYSGNLFGYAGTLKVNTLMPNLEMELEASDDYIIKRAIEEANIGNVSDYEVKQKTKIDIDDDLVDEIIYNVSNNMIADPNSLDGFRDTQDETVFSLVFMYKDNNIYVIDKKNSSTGDRMFELSNVLDIRNDGNVELIYVDKYPQTDDEQCAKLYDLSKNKLIHNFCE